MNNTSMNGADEQAKQLSTIVSMLDGTCKEEQSATKEFIFTNTDEMDYIEQKYRDTVT